MALESILDTSPARDIIDGFRSCADTVSGVIETHDIRFRMSGALYQMEIYAVVDRSLTLVEGHRIAKKIEGCLREEFNELSQVNVHVDPSEELRIRNGEKCFVIWGPSLQ